MASADIKTALEATLRRIEIAFARRPSDVTTGKPRLVAVSKTKPAEDVVEAYEAGQRHFGENYVQELVEKASHPAILEKCKDIKWHFIGHLQTNKIQKVIRVPGLEMIETVDSEKLANSLNKAWDQLETDNKKPLQILIQVNTSGEEAKSGVKPDETLSLYRHIVDNLPNLHVKGVMTIGKFDHDYATGPNEDFVTLMQCHTDICKANNLTASDVLVSMGMSADFEEAIIMGSSIVRVGSSIFGTRQRKSEC